MEMWFSFAATMSTRSGQHAVQNKPVADISFFSVAAVRDRGAKPAPWARSPTSRRSATGGVMRVRKMVTRIKQHALQAVLCGDRLKPGLRTEGAEDSNVSNRNQVVTLAAKPPTWQRAQKMGAAENGTDLSTVFDPLTSGSAGASPSQPIHGTQVASSGRARALRRPARAGFHPSRDRKRTLKQAPFRTTPQLRHSGNLAFLPGCH